MKRCASCGQFKPEEEFNWRYKSSEIRQPSCRECQHGHQERYYQNHIEEEKERTRRRRITAREKAREFVYSYLSTHFCVDCGETDPRVLEFDHIHGKAANVATLISEGVSTERLMIEISLCVVRCANCHRRKTSNERGWWKGNR